MTPVSSQITAKYLCYLLMRAIEKQHVDPEDLVFSPTRVRDFLAERGLEELSLPVYYPNRGLLHPRKLYALIFSDNNIELYLHK